MKTIELIPAIAPRDKIKTVELIARVKSFSDCIQIDIGDGKFTKEATLRVDDLPEQLFKHTEIEGHLMVQNVEEEVAKWLPYRPARLILHAEAKPSALLIQQIQHEGIEVGIALKADTDLAALSPYLHLVNFFLFLSISPPGEQGRPFIPEVLAKMNVFHLRHPVAIIEADGGINEHTMLRAVRAGATRLVMGSGIFWAERPASEQYIYLRQVLFDNVK